MVRVHAGKKTKVHGSCLQSVAPRHTLRFEKAPKQRTDPREKSLARLLVYLQHRYMLHLQGGCSSSVKPRASIKHHIATPSDQFVHSYMYVRRTLPELNLMIVLLARCNLQRAGCCCRLWYFLHSLCPPDTVSSPHASCRLA